MDRGQLLSELERLENNVPVVHVKMRECYAGQCSLEEAMIVSLIVCHRALEAATTRAVESYPPPLIILKSKEGN